MTFTVEGLSTRIREIAGKHCSNYPGLEKADVYEHLYAIESSLEGVRLANEDLHGLIGILMKKYGISVEELITLEEEQRKKREVGALTKSVLAGLSVLEEVVLTEEERSKLYAFHRAKGDYWSDCASTNRRCAESPGCCFDTFTSGGLLAGEPRTQENWLKRAKIFEARAFSSYQRANKFLLNDK